MLIKNILNYIPISERIATSGQPEEFQFKYIAQEGFQVVVNLAMPDSDNALADEGAIVTTQNMVYIHIPVPFESPSIEHLKMFLGVMDSFSDKKIWVHCAVNKRASAFLYQYQRLVTGKEHKEAEKFLLPDWKPEKIWQEFMELKLK